MASPYNASRPHTSLTCEIDCRVSRPNASDINARLRQLRHNRTGRARQEMRFARHPLGICEMAAIRYSETCTRVVLRRSNPDGLSVKSYWLNTICWTYLLYGKHSMPVSTYQATPPRFPARTPSKMEQRTRHSRGRGFGSPRAV